MQRKHDLPALQLSCELDVAYNTAWKLKHKILQLMRERNVQAQLFGRIEIDHTTIGGEHLSVCDPDIEQPATGW